MAQARAPELDSAEAEKFKAEAEAAKAVARKEEALAEQEEIKLRSAQRTELKVLAGDEHHHRYVFDKQFNLESVKACMDKLSEWSRLDPDCHVELVIYSPGGSVHAGMALFDRILELRRAGMTIDTHALGYAASMGGILLQAGDKRIMGRESYILIHEVQAGAIGTMGELEDEIDFLKMIQRRILHIFADRAEGKISLATLQRRWRRKNWWIDSDECLKLGIVDEVR